MGYSNPQNQDNSGRLSWIRAGLSWNMNSPRNRSLELERVILDFVPSRFMRENNPCVAEFQKKVNISSTLSNTGTIMDNQKPNYDVSWSI